MRQTFLALANALAPAGCVSIDGNQMRSWNAVTGGYRIIEIAPDISLVAAKSGLYFPSEIPVLPSERLALSLMGQGIESARKYWVDLADEICGAGQYKVYGEEEYAYRYTPAYPQHVAVKSAYIACNKGGYSEEAVKKMLDIK